MHPIVVTDILQLDSDLRTPDRLRFLECAVALYKLDGKRYTITTPTGIPTHVLEYGKVRGLRNVTGLAAYTLTLRKHRRLTQAQLASKLSVPAATISKMETGVLGDCSQLNQEHVYRVAAYLGFDVKHAMRLRN